MEAIKCPNCGSEKVKELSEEKYECLVCDNIFLVHNLSKEFRQTDAHITDVHEDISKKIDALSKNVASVSVHSDANNIRAKEVLVEAEDNLLKRKFSDAYVGFKKYVSFIPDSYVGYWGMYRAVSNMKKIKEEKDFYDGFDVLKKALECEDCDREEVLESTRKKYQEYVDTIFIPDLNEVVRIDCEENNIQQKDAETDIQQLIEFYESKKKNLEDTIETDKANNEESIRKYDALTENEKKEKLKKALIPPILVFVLTLIFLDGFLRILAIIIEVIWLCLAYAFNSKPLEWDEKDPWTIETRKKIDEQQKQVDYWKNQLEVLYSHSGVCISDIEKMICDKYSKGKTADEVYVKSRGKGDNKEMSVHDANTLMLTEVGANKVTVIRVIREITGLGLKEAKELVESAPVVILKDADYSAMAKAKVLLEAEGAKVTLI